MKNLFRQFATRGDSHDFTAYFNITSQVTNEGGSQSSKSVRLSQVALALVGTRLCQSVGKTDTGEISQDSLSSRYILYSLFLFP